MTAGTVIILVLQDRLTSVLHPERTAATVLARIATAKPRLVMDLGQVRVIDCSGLGLLASLCRVARDRGGDMSLLGLRDGPRRLLSTCGLLGVIPMFETEEAALSSIVSRDHSELYLERHRCGRARTAGRPSAGWRVPPPAASSPEEPLFELA